MLPLQIETTADGSPTLFVPALNEHYHSVHGALTESKHVFIENGLKLFEGKEVVSILEIGFGTGLNALLSYLEAQQKNFQIHYTAIELYPLGKAYIKQLHFPDLFKTGRSFFDFLHDCDWEQEIIADSHFTLHKIKGDLTKYRFNCNFDLIYFDAFAPDKQAEMWTPEIFAHLYEQTNENGILTTYCAKGSVRRMLQAAGYTTERLPGPPGKREMLRAKKKA